MKFFCACLIGTLLLSSAFAAIENGTLPIVLWHGMGKMSIATIFILFLIVPV